MGEYVGGGKQGTYRGGFLGKMTWEPSTKGRDRMMLMCVDFWDQEVKFPGLGSQEGRNTELVGSKT